MIEALEQGRRGTIVVRTNSTGTDRFSPATRVADWDPTSAMYTTDGGVQSPALGLGHELAHAAGDATWTRFLTALGPPKGWEKTFAPIFPFRSAEEIRVIWGWEAGAARHLGEGLRWSHYGYNVRVLGPTPY